ncbi:type II toxin-antitoxin system VapC family toxin [Mucilaginibacter sp. BJC16-A38]|uniref:type II toxin-antitoxin system VapC family toxin n=1 Tax=Mucilaginibacter phenanthrenivorans TaxID=1234842 RepID=UPI0021588147|nr:type II toxin-antitoxin system VapC family toxin [Mucilaginibacter phenanthrenivorans]MCR8561406.1 type II toxin-antitoxin system VapC family toxin [Mucilaginibacter phenanthrenivorans]
MVIFDTNILIEIYRGNSVVQNEIQQIKSDTFYISSVTAAEFMAGARDKADFQRINNHLDKYTIISINSDISDIFIDLFKTYTLSHRPAIADTLIAATALYHHLPLYTLNKKDFRFIPGLKLI